MKSYFSLNTISEEEKSNILSQHRTLYNGYQTLNPNIPNTQPLYTQDFAKDKTGAVMGNNGKIQAYTNMGINEQSETEEMCNECGGMMYEGECNECGWKGEMDEETGHLDDIYDEQDLNPNAEFDYVKGASNKTNAYHIKEQGGNADDPDVTNMKPAYDFQSDGPMDGGDSYPVNEYNDDESFASLINKDAHIEDERDELDEMDYEPMESAWSEEMDEVDVSGSQGVYGDMDPAYDFDSNGPGGAGPYQTRNEEEDDEFEEIDEDLKESLIEQKNRITEMINRMKLVK